MKRVVAVDFRTPQKGQKFGCWALKKLKIVQKICPLLIFDILPEKYDSFISSSSHFQKIHPHARSVILFELGVTLVSPPKKGVKDVFVSFLVTKHCF